MIGPIWDCALSTSLSAKDYWKYRHQGFVVPVYELIGYIALYMTNTFNFIKRLNKHQRQIGQRLYLHQIFSAHSREKRFPWIYYFSRLIFQAALFLQRTGFYFSTSSLGLYSAQNGWRHCQNEPVSPTSKGINI